MRVVVSLLGLQLAHAFCLRVPSNHVPRVSVTATVCASAHRREALGVLCTGVGLAVLAHTTSAEAKSPRQAPAESRDSVSVGFLPMAVGLGTCCPCDVRGEEDGLDDDSAAKSAESVCDATYLQVTSGLSAGYRFIDTASHYNNERSVGAAIEDAVATGTVQRDQVCVCTKVWFDDLGYDKTLASVAASNARLSPSGGSGADMVLIHFPGTIDSVQSPAKNKKLRQESWKALEKLKKDGKVRAIGVSNYVRRHLKELLASCAVKPDIVEMEIHPFMQQPELVAMCQDNGIQVVGFSPLAHGDLPVLKNKVLSDIAQSYDKTVPQVVLRWMAQEGIVPIVKSASAARLAQNREIDDFELSATDMKMIRTLDAGKRVGFDPGLIA